MAKYSSDFNNPSLSLDNVATHVELRDNVSTHGAPNLVNSTQSFADTTLALNNILTEIFAIKTLLPGVKDIADPSGVGATTNANITATDKTFASNLHNMRFRLIQSLAQHLSRELHKLSATLTTEIGGSGTNFQGSSIYPSDWNRGY